MIPDKTQITDSNSIFYFGKRHAAIFMAYLIHTEHKIMLWVLHFKEFYIHIHTNMRMHIYIHKHILIHIHIHDWLWLSLWIKSISNDPISRGHVTIAGPHNALMTSSPERKQSEWDSEPMYDARLLIVLYMLAHYVVQELKQYMYYMYYRDELFFALTRVLFWYWLPYLLHTPENKHQDILVRV